MAFTLNKYDIRYNENRMRETRYIFSVHISHLSVSPNTHFNDCEGDEALTLVVVLLLLKIVVTIAGGAAVAVVVIV